MWVFQCGDGVMDQGTMVIIECIIDLTTEHIIQEYVQLEKFVAETTVGIKEFANLIL